MNYTGPERRADSRDEQPQRAYSMLLIAMLRYRTITLEWFLALQGFVCGTWVLAVLLFYGMARFLIPLVVLGAAFAIHGVLYVWVLSRGKSGQSRTSRNLDMCRWLALASAMLWLMLTLACAVSRPFGIATPLVLGFVLSALWVYLRLFLRFKDS